MGERELRTRVVSSVVLALVALVVAAAPALGAGVLQTTSMAPAQNTKIPAGSSPTFRVESPCKGMGLQAYVSQNPSVDGDGKFIAPTLQDSFALPETAFGSGVYEGTTNGVWLQQPGTYYWQVTTVADCGGGASQFWATVPIAVMVVGTTQPSGDGTVEIVENGDLLTVNEARDAVPIAIKKITLKSPKSLKRICTRKSSGSILAVVCSSSWLEGKAWRYAGLFTMALNDDGTIAVRFTGNRATQKCLKKNRKGGAKRCYKRWNFTTELS